MAATPRNKDFDADSLAPTTAQHGKDIAALTERLAVVEAKLSQPEQIAAVFEAATSDSKKLDKLLARLFCGMIEKDVEVGKAVRKCIQECDRDAVRSMLKKWGGFITAGAVFIAGLVAREIVTFVMSKVGH